MIRQLQMLQEAAPVLIRHLGAYAELAGQDVEMTKSRLLKKLKFGAFALIGAVFSLVSICLVVVAATWDTPYRLLAIGIMGALFLLATIVASVLATRGKPVTAFESVKREWGQDRLILERLLGDSHDSKGAIPSHASHRAARYSGEQHVEASVDLNALSRPSHTIADDESINPEPRPH